MGAATNQPDSDLLALLTTRPLGTDVVLRVRNLLEAGASPEARVPPFDWSILYEVMKSGPDRERPMRREIARTLVKHGALVDAPAYRGHTLLALLIHHRRPVEDLQFLIELGADINCAGDSGYTPLEAAITRSTMSVLKLLLQLGADPNRAASTWVYPDPSRGTCGRIQMPAKSALFHTLEPGVSNPLGRVKLLLEFGADPVLKVEGMSFLEYAARSCAARELDYLRFRGYDDPALTGDPWAAAACGEIEAARRWSASVGSIDCPDELGRTPLAMSVMAGRAEMTHMLLTAGAAPGQRLRWRWVSDRTCYRCPPGESHWQDGWPLLVVAAEAGLLVCVQLLLDAGADIDATDPDRTTNALVSAIKRGDEPLVELLLGAGADPDIVLDALTPLHHAMESGSRSIVWALWEHGADLHARGETTGPVIHVAPAPLMSWLVIRGVDIDQPDAVGRTALQLAAWEGRVGEVSEALQLGASPRRRDAAGKTALDLAREELYAASPDRDPETIRRLEHVIHLLEAETALSTDV